ncbi:DUF4255 domain-containing protein [Pseudanabaena sp. PCC 6802]|uniref:DUF4255 domain-containing protein n=1 Tax=Pseudanabaena sp. PCC 6802 TaxID=118173 RepID=UPI0003470BE9|nr:DUF4255 domain-containing protein [Pseudanabaena sp. PCC 6802]
MLDIALTFLKNELNTYLQTQIGSDSATVEIVNLVDETGKYTVTNSIAASIINIEEDRIFKSQVPDRIYANGQHVILEPDLKLNLYVLFAANFPKDSSSRPNYDQALKYISYILMYFQMHPAFTSLEYPALDSRIDKLTAELQSLNYEQLNQIWAFIGAKQLPSLIYKIRMVSVQGMVPKAIQLPIMEVKTNLHSR